MRTNRTEFQHRTSNPNQSFMQLLQKPERGWRWLVAITVESSTSTNFFKRSLNQWNYAPLTRGNGFSPSFGKGEDYCHAATTQFRQTGITSPSTGHWVRLGWGPEGIAEA